MLANREDLYRWTQAQTTAHLDKAMFFAGLDRQRGRILRVLRVRQCGMTYHGVAVISGGLNLATQAITARHVVLMRELVEEDRIRVHHRPDGSDWFYATDGVWSPDA